MIWLCDWPVDWGATGDFLSGVGTLAGVFAVIWAAKKGAATFDQWRQQKIAETQIEKAERILAVTYKTVDNLTVVRNPFPLSSEEDDAYRFYESTPEWREASEDKRKRLIVHRYYGIRLQRAAKVLSEIDDCRPMAKAFFHPKVEEALRSLGRQFFALDTYIDNYLTETVFTEGMGLRIKLAMYPQSEDQVSEMDDEIRDAKKAIEDELLPILRHESKR